MRFRYSYRKMAKIFANRRDPDSTPHSVASDLGLHCLPITLLGVPRLQWVNNTVMKTGNCARLNKEWTFEKSELLTITVLFICISVTDCCRKIIYDKSKQLHVYNYLMMPHYRPLCFHGCELRVHTPLTPDTRLGQQTDSTIDRLTEK